MDLREREYPRLEMFHCSQVNNKRESEGREEGKEGKEKQHGKLSASIDRLCGYMFTVE